MCFFPSATARLLLGAVLLALSAQSAWGAGGAVIVLPQPGTKIKSGLLLTVDLRGIDANGYRPVRIEIKPLAGTPLPADRQVRVALTPQSYNSSQTPEVSQVIELPEGSTSVTATIAVPQSSQWYSCSIETFEDGDKLDDLSIPYMGFPGVNYWDWTEARPTILVVDRQVPDRATREKLVADFKFRGTDPSPTNLLPEVRGISNLFPDPQRGATYFAGQQVSDATLLSQIVDLPRLNMLPPAELPERWIELSQYDLMIFRLDDLKNLAQSDPQRFRAVAEWSAGGPLLIVYGVGDDFAGLAAIEEVLKLPRLSDDAVAGSEFRGWQPADNARHTEVLNSEVEDYESAVMATTRPAFGQRYPNPVLPQTFPNYQRGQKPNLLPAAARPPFAIRENGLGKIVAIASDKPFPGQDTDWIWMFNSVPRNHWMWYQRHGFSLHRANDDYWTFLIPGVGEAPVVSFLLLVSLFAVVIGPVNYMLLGRARRLYLLLVTVPLGAVLMTGGLFTYALLTDGLGIKVRARTFTQIDQQSGRAVGWARQSYYAALAPSRGLSFPADTAVFQIVYQPTRNSGGGQPNCKLRWDENQHLAEGYMSSRTATQFMVLRATQAREKLVVREGRSAGQPPQVTNQLGTPLGYLVLRDSRGDYWQGEKLAEGAQLVLAAATEQEASERLHKLYGADPLEFPRGYDPNVHNNALSLFMPNYGWYNVDTSSSLPVMSASLLESNLATATRPVKNPLPAGMYVAVGGRSPVVPYGVPRVQEEASLHVIRGSY